MDTTSRRPQLPALSYLDVSNVKKTEDMYQSGREFGTPKHAGGPPASPMHQYPSAPPPPYTHPSHQHANTWANTNPPGHTPPDSRRTSGDDHGSTKQSNLQSLPSITEAIGPLDNQASYAHTSSTTQAPPLPQLPTPQSGAPRSPSSATRQPYPMEPPQPLPSQYSFFRQDSAGPPHPSTDHAKSGYGPSSDHRPSMPTPTPHPPRTQASSYSYSHPTSPPFEQHHSNTPGSMPPPQSSTFAYGYAPYPPRFAQPPTNGNSGPVYQPSTQYPAPPTPSAAWKSQSSSARYQDERPAPAAYGESVKRHLDMFDFESSLNEVHQTSGVVMDFCRRYGDRMHRDARTGPSLETLPSTVEVEDMIQKARSQTEHLSKIREVVLTQKAAYDQQLADQHHRQRHETFAETAPPSAAESYQEADDAKGGFAGSETKKRRGRAAPPGRCHSCNRAETPEWRRGPDGARTLCNACGLHYAKLTRKQTTNGKNGNVGNSNLRPKED